MAGGRRRFRDQTLGGILLGIAHALLSGAHAPSTRRTRRRAAGQTARTADHAPEGGERAAPPPPSTALFVWLAVLLVVVVGGSIVGLSRLFGSSPPAVLPPGALASPTAGVVPTAPPAATLVVPGGTVITPTLVLGGTGAAALSVPQEALTGPGGVIYVADTGNHRVAVLDKHGRLRRAITDGPHGPLQSPFSLALAPDGDLVVLDSDAGLVIVYDDDGKLVRSSAASLNLSHARGIAVDAAGRVYVADPASNAVYTLGPDLSPLHTEPAQTGSGPALFNQPAAVAVGADGTIYVADNQDTLVVAFSSAWKPLASWPVAPSDSQHSPRILPLAGGRILVSDPRDQKLLLLGGAGEPRAFDLAAPAGAPPCVPLGIGVARLPTVLVTCNGAGQVWQVPLPGI